MSSQREPKSDLSGTGEGSPNRADTMALAGGALVSFLGKMAGRLLQVATQVVFARYLGVADFGRFSLAATILRIIGIIAPFGVHRAAVVFGAAAWRHDDARFRGVALETLGIAAIGGVTCAIALAAFAPFLGEEVFRNAVPSSCIRAVALALPVVAILRVAVDFGRVSQRMELGALAEDLVQPFVALAVFWVLFSQESSLDVAIGATVTSYVAAAAVAVCALPILFPGVFWRGVAPSWAPGEVIAFSAPTSLAILCGAFTSLLDRLVVGRYCLPEEMGVYQAAAQVSVVFTIIIGSFTTIFAPMAARFVALADRRGLESLFQTSTKWGLYLGLPVFLTVVVAPDAILRVLFGTSYGDGSLALTLLATGQIVNVATGNVGILLVTAGRQMTWLGIAVAATLVNATIGVLLVGELGILGAAAGNLLATIVLYGGGTLFVRTQLGIWAWRRSTFRLVVAGAIALGTGSLWRMYAPVLADLPCIATTAMMITTTFGMLCWRLGLDSDDRLLLGRIVERFGRSAVLG